jgi:2-polyprenyl-6-methoxyphenol hydroxylase-like FAD-dependent oxidoreductase
MARNLEQLTVVVAGAGPGGSVAALMLARAGAQVTLLERSADRHAAGAGLLLQPNGLAVLHALGLGDQLEAVGHKLTSATVRDGFGRNIVSVDVPDFGAGLDHALAVHRAHLADVLDEALAAEPSIEIARGAEVLLASPDGDVWYARHHEVHHVRADLVVGADGIRSAVRAGGDFGDRMRRTARFYVRGIANSAPDVPHGEFWTAIGLFGCAPLGDGTTYFYADVTAPASAAAVAGGDTNGLIEIWRRAVPAASALLDDIDPTTPLVLTETGTVECDRFSDGRLVLVGDAAHAMAPTLGQGANSAFLDAAVLCAELAGDGDVPAALARYDAVRRPAVRKVQHAADRLARASAIRSGLGRGLRDGAIRVVSRLRDNAPSYVASMQCDPVDLTAQVADLSATSARPHAPGSRWRHEQLDCPAR